FSEATIQVSNPNQEMFVAAFHNGLKAGHFNESLDQKPASSMQEIIKRAECYIKGEESNAEKRSREAKEKGTDKGNARTPDRSQRRWSQLGGWIRQPYQSPPRRNDRPFNMEPSTPLNTTRVNVLDEILQARLAELPPTRSDEGLKLGPNLDEWCAYHRCRGHDIE
ncbi:hypothetical protein A2U01_0046851, partial [Trifolium medium]|nr:hypothetical protein [Trifolium medium]